MALSLSAIRKWIGKLTDVLIAGRSRGWWSRGNGPKVGVVVLALFVIGCGFKIPQCIIDGSCLPKPSPSPQASPSPCPDGTVRDTIHGQPAGCIPWPPPSASPTPSSPPASPSVPPSPPPASPSPEPSASPSPAASPSPTPSPVGSVIPVVDGQCPNAYPRKPNHVKVGRNARRAPANPFAWLINLSPLMNADQGYCADVNGGTRTYPGYPGMCEQWLPCAFQGRHDDADPQSSWEPAVYAEGPGFPWDHVESRSRDAAAWEKPCPAEDKHCYINYYLKNLVLGDGGSGPGHYRVCAAPTEAEVSDRNHIGPNAECAEFDLTLP